MAEADETETDGAGLEVDLDEVSVEGAEPGAATGDFFRNGTESELGRLIIVTGVSKETSFGNRGFFEDIMFLLSNK